MTPPPVRLLERGSADWPACLAHLGAGEPKRLHVRGPLALTARLRAARRRDGRARGRPSAAGERFARTLARELAEAGVSVISGLALGIDAACARRRAGRRRPHGRRAGLRHRPRLPAPQRRARGAHRRDGAIVSEWGPGVEPAPWRFPVRNRIVAALAQATVVVEATRRSGALITADHALALGRDVLAVPGAPWLELGGGTLALLRAGAAPVGSAGDVLDALGVQMAVEPARLEPPAGVAGVLWSELRRRPRRRDALALATGLGADVTSAGPGRAGTGRPGRRGARRHPVRPRAGPPASGKLVGRRGVAQLVERRSPKPKVAGSSPVAPVRSLKPKYLDKH